jgi:DNA-binding transcriptional MerR regulator
MTIQELARKARVTPRTIRYYVEQGVLPPPGRGRPADYADEHLDRLALIRRLKEQYLPLEEIRDTLQHLTLEEVEELLTHSAQPKKESAHANSASEYIAKVLNQTAVREEMKRNSTQPSMPLPASPSPMPVLTPASAAWQAPAQGYERAEARSRYTETSPLEPPPTQMEQTGTWQRITVEPGIELHYLLTNGARTKSIAAQILQAAQEILDNYPDEDTEETK